MEQLSPKDFKDGNHPVHIMVNSAEGNLSTSAFTPFYTFAGDMALVGQSVDGFSLPVCNIFHPIEVLSNPFYCMKTGVFTAPRWRGNFVFQQILVRLRTCLLLTKEVTKVCTV